MIYRKRRIILLCCFILTILLKGYSQNESQNTSQDVFPIQQYTLENGLTVYLSEDHNKPEVFGGVIMKAGGKNDPPDATGIAHYLEHMLFKGTQEMGTMDYNKEKIYLAKIDSFYNELSNAKNSLEREKIQKEINELSIKAAEYAIPGEMDRLLESIGAKEVNAFTSDDITFFHNYFPANQINKWLEIYSHRFINPVFRLFQSELETVYEEKNKAVDNIEDLLIENFNHHFYKKHPYGQQTILGSMEHLKNPSLKKMREFYKTYYVANNMALLLCGDFNADEIMPLIEEKFGTWPSGEVQNFPDYNEEPFKGREVITKRLTPVKMQILGYRTPPVGNAEEVVVDVCNALLFNRSNTGLLDKLKRENKLFYLDWSVKKGIDYSDARFYIVPKILVQSFNTAEKIVLSEILKLQSGEFEDWLLQAVKEEICREYKTSYEDLFERSMLIADAFAQGGNLKQCLNYPEKVKAITKEDVINAAKKYFGSNYFVLRSRTGFPKKNRLKKPFYKPVVPPQKNVKSAFAQRLETLTEAEFFPKFVDAGKDVKQEKIMEKVKLYYTKNPYNDIFSMTIKFGIGYYKIPTLKYATDLMNFAGTERQSLTDLKAAFNKIGCIYHFSCDESYVSIELSGAEENFPKALELLYTLINKPLVGKDKIKTVVNNEKVGRRHEKTQLLNLAKALFNYIKHKKESKYVRRLSRKQLKLLDPETLVAQFKDALNYETTIHYTGKNSLDTVTGVIKDKFFFSPCLKDSDSPVVLNGESYHENTIFVVNKRNAVQSHIVFYLEGYPYFKTQDPIIDAFNRYFGDQSLSSLLFQELREYRSLAYSVYAVHNRPPLEGKASDFFIYAGCQADKTNETLELMNHLVKDMPYKAERIQSIKTGLILTALSNRPHFRELTLEYETWFRKGYQQDPGIAKIPVYRNLQFDDIREFYEKNIKNKPIAIGIVGDKRRINMKELSKYGKVVKLKQKDIIK